MPRPPSGPTLSASYLRELDDANNRPPLVIYNPPPATNFQSYRPQEARADEAIERHPAGPSDVLDPPKPPRPPRDGRDFDDDDDNDGVDIEDARFAQRDYSESFNQRGQFAGRTIDEIAELLRTGALSVKDVPVNVIVRDGFTLIHNTRSAQALTRAGIARGSWNVVNRTGDKLYESLVTGQLRRNALGSTGYLNPVSTGRAFGR